MARTFTAEEIAAEAGVAQDLVAWLVSIGIVKPERPGTFRFGDVFRVKLVSALLDAGVTTSLMERAAVSRWLNLDHVDAYLPREPSPRSDRTFADFVASAGTGASVLPVVYEVLGLPKPDPSLPIHLDEEAMFERFFEGWNRLTSDEEVLLRAARLLGEGARIATMGWAELFEEQVGRPTRDRLAGGEIDRFPEEAALAIGSLISMAPELFAWLSYRYVEQRFVAGIVDGVERFLATHGVVPMPPSMGPPAIVFVDVSGFTRLTEERGDEAAVRTATSLQRQADAVATRRGGRLVKLLGDGALLQFFEVRSGVEAALDLVETLGTDESLLAHAGIHAGPVIERDLDVFGRTVNLASRIAASAGRGEVLASQTVVEAAHDESLRFERIDERSFKGIEEPVVLFRVTRPEH